MSDAAVVWSPSTFNVDDRITAGALSFSTVPTIAEINASSWMNQIIALCNRRSSQVIAGYSPVAYVAAGNGYIAASHLIILRNQIDGLRVTLGLSVYAWGATAVSGAKITKVMMDDLRAALALPGTRTIFPSDYYQSTRTDDPSLGSQVSASSTVPGNFFRMGIERTGTPGAYTYARHRGGFSFLLPSFVNLPSTVTAQYRASILSEFWPVSDVIMDLYSSDTDDHAGGGTWWNHLDHFCDSVQFGAIQHGAPFEIPNAVLAARSGNYLSLVLGQTDEMVNAYTASGFGQIDLTDTHELVIDYGF